MLDCQFEEDVSNEPYATDSKLQETLFDSSEILMSKLGPTDTFFS